MKVGDRMQRAMLGIVHAVIFSDGEIRAEEVDWVHTVVRKNRFFHNLDDESWLITVGAVLDEWNSAPLAVVLNRWIEALAGSTAVKQICFELAIDAAFADDEVAEIEQGVLGYLARAWEFSEHYLELAYRGAIERKLNAET